MFDLCRATKHRELERRSPLCAGRAAFAFGWRASLPWHLQTSGIKRAAAMSPHQAALTAFSRLNKASLGTRRLPHCAKIDCACLLRDLRFQLIQIKSGSKISNADKGGSDKKALTMGASTIVCVEVERPNGPLRKWEDTLSADVRLVDLLFAAGGVSRFMDKRSVHGAYRI